MYSAAGSTHQYLNTQVQSSSPVERVVLLYDAAVLATTNAREAMARRDIPARRAAISKAMAIVTELQCSLDLEQGGKVADELDRLYHWMTDRLMDAVTRQDVKPLDEVHKILLILADAWRSVATTKPESGP